jgi:outer membrane murein-binding lipoprotein Lpp
MALRALVLGAVVIVSALALAGCKAEKEESEVATPAEVAAGCREGASKMFATDEAAQAEKFARCMAKRLGDDWQEKNPELKPAE